MHMARNIKRSTFSLPYKTIPRKWKMRLGEEEEAVELTLFFFYKILLCTQQLYNIGDRFVVGGEWCIMIVKC